MVNSINDTKALVDQTKQTTQAAPPPGSRAMEDLIAETPADTSRASASSWPSTST